MTEIYKPLYKDKDDYKYFFSLAVNLQGTLIAQRGAKKVRLDNMFKAEVFALADYLYEMYNDIKREE